VTNALGVALYGMFVAIVVPQMKAHRPTLIAVLIAIACSCAFRYVPALSGVTVGFAIIICALVASLLGAALFPVKDDEDDTPDGQAGAQPAGEYGQSKEGA
jgi:predicted branched-subunit amino acid permease